MVLLLVARGGWGQGVECEYQEVFLELNQSDGGAKQYTNSLMS